MTRGDHGERAGLGRSVAGGSHYPRSARTAGVSSPAVAGYDEHDERPTRRPRRSRGPVPASEVAQGVLVLVLLIAAAFIAATAVVWWWRVFVG